MANIDRVAATVRISAAASGTTPEDEAVLSTTKANSPPAPRTRPVSMARRGVIPEHQARPAGYGRFEHDEADGRAKDQHRLLHQAGEIQTDADRQEEQAEE